MDCVPVFRDDYLCRDGSNFRSTSNQLPDSHALYNDILCRCGADHVVNTPVRHAKKVGVNSCEWSRLEPMGYLLEPKLHPINACSELRPMENFMGDRSRLTTINDKCYLPFTIEPIPLLPPADILRRINEDRMRSTYQTHFAHMDDYPWASYDNIMISAGYKTGRISEKPREEIKCRERARLPYLAGHDIPGRRPKDSASFGTRRSMAKRSGPQGTNLPLRPVTPKQVSRQSKDINDDHHITKDAVGNERSSTLEDPTGDDITRISKDNANGKRISRESADDKNRQSRSSSEVKENSEDWELLPSLPWTSEYQDIISRTADDILRSKLHYHGRLRLVTPNPDCP